jgi:UDP-N-acetylmuramate dehydrogenase
VTDAVVARALRGLGLEPRLGVSVAKLGFWRLGGPVDVWVEVPSRAQLEGVMALGAPVTVLGNGSNSLVSDAGLRGVGIRLAGELREARFGEDALGPRVEAGGGLLNAVLLRRVEQAGLGGLAALAGVPGTVGGAIRLNAGTALGEIGAAVLSVDVVLPGGQSRTLQAEDLCFRYRHATLPEGAVVVAAALRLRAEGVEEERAAIAHHLQRRKATQPLELPSCGSVFKNPPGDHAGRLIEAAGLKGARRGDAQISEKHANFIVNLGHATAADVLALIRLARDTVREQTGVVLEPEVHVLGDWGEDPLG